MIKKLFSLIGLIPFLVSAQFFQGFEDATMPSDWKVINGGDAKTWQTYTSYSGFNAVNPHTGSRFVGIEYSASAHNDYLISPSFTVVQGISDKLSFWAKNTGTAYAEQFDLLVSETSPTAESFTQTIATAIKPSGTEWQQFNYDLSSYEGKTIYLAFLIKTTNQWFVGIDDVSVHGVLAVSEINKKLNNVSVYPNPVKDLMRINNESNFKIKTAEIFNTVGSRVKTVNITNGKDLDLSFLSKGVYLIKFKSDDAESSVIRFIKE